MIKQSRTNDRIWRIWWNMLRLIISLTLVFTLLALTWGVWQGTFIAINDVAFLLIVGWLGVSVAIIIATISVWVYTNNR